MNRTWLLSSLLLGSFLLSACGAKAGDACKDSTAFSCASEKEALECRNSEWRALPCRGSEGCDEASGKVVCDMRGSVEGDACALTAEGRGLCTEDGKGVLECRMGTLVRTRACGTCSMDNALVSCVP
ncbi:hypothetical protein [Cystobacter fuscus]|uniref:hypothetical protein n=1 Tax=Cystobacter fuscus TaxID=43 RepID=UPI0037BED84A